MATVEQIARVCHEANRAWCVANEDFSQLAWDVAPDWQRESVIIGVKGALDGNSPEESHQSWLDTKAHLFVAVVRALGEVRAAF